MNIYIYIYIYIYIHIYIYIYTLQTEVLDGGAEEEQVEVSGVALERVHLPSLPLKNCVHVMYII